MRYYKQIIFLLVAMLSLNNSLGTVHILGYGNSPNIEKAISVLQSPQATDDSLIKSIAALRKNARQALGKELLTDICRNQAFSPIHRRRCLLQLFALYSSNGMTLKDLKVLTSDGTVLNGGLHFSKEWNFTPLTEIQDDDWIKDTVLELRLALPKDDKTTIYLRVEGLHAVNDLEQALTLPAQSPLLTLRLKQIIIWPSDEVDALLLYLRE